MASTLTAAVRKLKRIDSTATDRELLDRHAAGDEEAFAALVHRHGKAVLAACRQVLTDPADIDDAFQATFVVLLKKAKAVTWQATLGSWLYAVAHRLAVHARCARARRATRESAAAKRRSAEAESPDFSWREAVAVLHEELNQLPERYRRVLLLCYLEGQSRDEAAANLGVSPGAVKGHLERGRDMLAARLTRRGVSLSAGLLAVLSGNSASAAGGPSLDLIKRTARAAGGAIPPAVAALCSGAIPMTLGTKHVLTALFAVGLLATAIGLTPADVAATDPPAKAKAEKQPVAPTPVKLTGTVVGPDGKPVAGAAVWLCRPDRLIGAKHPAPKKIATTDADGTFAVEETPDGGKLRGYPVAASKAGFGVGFARPDASDKAALRCSLALVPDDVPIRGRILDLQGKPVAGATIRPIALLRSDAENLDAWEKAARRSTQEVANHSHEFFPHSIRLADGAPDGVPTVVKMAKDGTFTVTGLGRDRLVTLRVSGPGVATAEFDAVTRDMPTVVTPKDKLESNDSPRTYHGAKFDFAVEPSQPFVGTVTDKATGKPVAGVVVRASHRWDESVFAVSDANGQYRLDGLKTGEQKLIAVPSVDAPYYLREFTAGRPANDQPVTANVELHKGVWVSGTVTDQVTGKPVSASLSYRPYTFDTTAEDIPGYIPRGLHDVSWYGTDKDGRFRVLAVPGQGYVFVRATGGRYLTADQCDWQGDVKKPDPESFTPSSPVDVSRNWNAIGLVTVRDGQAAKEYAFTVDPGTALTVRLLDPDGKPVAGAMVTGRTNLGPFAVAKLDTADVTFEQVNPKRPRPALVLHDEKHLGALFITKPAEKGATEIRLKPTATVRGRLLTGDGKPMPLTPVKVQYAVSEEDGWKATKLFPQVTTDADGKFVIPNMVEGVRYELRWPRPAPKAANGYHGFTAKSGEAKNLGDVGGKSGDD